MRDFGVRSRIFKANIMRLNALAKAETQPVESEEDLDDKILPKIRKARKQFENN